MDAEILAGLYGKSLASSEPPLPPYLAAVQTLTTALSQSKQPLQTLAETLALLSSLSASLKSGLSHTAAVAISAGTDTFQRQLVTSLARNSHGEAGEDGTDADTRSNVIKAGQSFIQRQLEARSRLATFGPRFIRPGMTLVVPTSTPSRNIESMLHKAAEAAVPFRVVFVEASSDKQSAPKPTCADATSLQGFLKETGTPIGTTAVDGLAHVLGARDDLPGQRQLWPPRQTIVLADAVAIMASGGALASLQTQCAASIAHSFGREVWIVGETGKIVRDMDLQRIGPNPDVFIWSQTARAQAESSGERLDITPADFITGFITEDGPRTTTFITEEVIKIWF